MPLENLSNYSDKYTNMSLNELAITFLNRHNFKYSKIESNGLKTRESKLNFLITGQKGKDLENPVKTGLIVKDYKKSTGADTICQVERLTKELGQDVNQIILLANEFSVPARNLAERCGVPTISRGELISMLWNPTGL